MISNDFVIVFAMSEPNEEIKFILQNESFELILLQPFKYSLPDSRNDQEIHFDLHDCIEHFDKIILDGYWFGKKYQSELRKFPIKIIIIEDYGYGEYIADVLINTAEGLSKRNYDLDNPKALLLLGSDFSLLRPSFLQIAKEGKYPTREGSKVFICFGGSDILNKTLEVSSWFLVNTECNLIVVVGKAYPYLKKLYRLNSQYPGRLRLRIALNEDEIINEMYLSSFGVVPASGILLESIACRLPVISGVYVANQRQNYDGLLAKGAFYPAENFLPHQLKIAWSELDECKRIEIMDNQVKVIDGCSGMRIKQCLTKI